MNIATIIVDMQNEFVDRVPRIDRNSLIKSQLKIIDYSIANKLFLLNITYNNSGRTINSIRSAIKKYEREMGFEAYFETKHNDSIFENTYVANTLKELEVKKIIIMGVNALACIHESVVDASHNFEVHLTNDTIGANSGSVFNYINLDERKMRLKGTFEDVYGTKKYPDLDNILYHDNYKKVISFLDSGM